MAGLRLAAPLVVALLAVLVSGAANAQPARTIPVPARPGADFAREVTLDKHSFVYVSGHADFDDVYSSLIAALKKVRGYLEKEGVAPTGPPLARYTDGGQSGFQFEAGYPVAEPPKNMPQTDIAVGETPSGKMLDFVHRGSFSTMDETYAAIDDFFRDRRKSTGGDDPEHDELANSFEQYTTDPLSSDPEKLEVHVLVPIK